MGNSDNCEVAGFVDFGHGPVEIRCTVIGPHDDHECHVRITSASETVAEVIHKNAFEEAAREARGYERLETD